MNGIPTVLPVKKQQWDHVDVYECVRRISDLLEPMIPKEISNKTLMGFASDFEGIDILDVAALEGEIDAIVTETIGNHPIANLMNSRVQELLYGHQTI